MSTEEETAIFVAGNSRYSMAILQGIQVSLDLPVFGKINDHWITKKQNPPSIELLLCPYGCDNKNCPLSQDIFQNKIRRVAIYNVPNDDAAFELLQKGATGVFYSNDPIDVISKGARIMLNNELWFKRILTSHYFFLVEEQLQRFNLINGKLQLSSKFSKRESEVLALLVSGSKNLEIADKLFISVHTVKTHVHHILKKLGATNRTEIVARMINHQFYH